MTFDREISKHCTRARFKFGAYKNKFEKGVRTGPFLFFLLSPCYMGKACHSPLRYMVTIVIFFQQINPTSFNFWHGVFKNKTTELVTDTGWPTVI